MGLSKVNKKCFNDQYHAVKLPSKSRLYLSQGTIKILNDIRTNSVQRQPQAQTQYRFVNKKKRKYEKLTLKLVSRNCTKQGQLKNRMKLCFVTVEKHPDVTVGRSKMQILFCFCIRSLYQHNQHVRVLFSTALDNIFT